jgi:hypothetical protein
VSKRRTIKKRLRRAFPGLRAAAFLITSRATAQYNCIAWAAEDPRTWWEALPGYHWPSALRDGSVAAAVALFEGLGFVTATDGRLESGLVKVAVYGDEHGYTHAARQLPSGA